MSYTDDNLKQILDYLHLPRVPGYFVALSDALKNAEETNKISAWRNLSVLAFSYRERELAVFAKRKAQNAQEEILKSRGRL